MERICEKRRGQVLLTSHSHARRQIRRSGHPLDVLPRRALVSVGPDRRAALVELLRRAPLELAITSNVRQLLARAALTCSERVCWRTCHTDFDLVLIDGELVQDAVNLITLLRRTGYGGPVAAWAVAAGKQRELLAAGFSKALPYSTMNVKNILHELWGAKWTHQMPLRPRLSLCAEV